MMSTRRSVLMVSTSLSGGVLAAMLMVGQANAACVTTGNQTVCNPLDANLTVTAAGPNLSTTVDILNANPGFLVTVNGAPTPSSGSMAVTVGSGVNLVSGAGQHGLIGNGNGDTLVVTVTGNVTGTGGSGLALNSGPGTNGTFVVANGAITGALGDGVRVNNTGTGAVNITGVGAITGTSPNLGITVNNTNAGVVHTDIRQTGVITGGSGGGISVQHIGSGNITIGTNDQAIRQVVASGGIGIEASTNGAGIIGVVTGGSIGGGVADGIVTTADAGATTVIVGGNITAATGGVSATANAGRVDIVNNGTTTLTGSGNGIFVNTTTGVVNVTNQGAITTNGGVGINVNSTTGALTVLNEASRTVLSGTGVRAIATGAGNVFVENDGTIRGTTGSGVSAQSAGGAVTVENNATVQGATSGVFALSTGAGVVNVLNSGAIAGGTGRGVFAQTDAGNIYIGNDASSSIVSTSGGGILAVSTSGNIRLDNAGVIDGGSASTGATLTTAGAGSIFVQNERSITGNTHGLQMTSAGSGPITYIGAGSVSGGIGIEAIQGPAGTGAITINGTGNVTGTTGAGIIAQINNAANASRIDVLQSGAITGANGGITATTNGTGSVTVAGVGDVQGGAGNGITASSAGGNVTVTTARTVNGAGDGINAASTLAGAVTVTANGAIGNLAPVANGIVTSAGTGANTVTVNSNITATNTGVRMTTTGGRADFTNTGAVTAATGASVSTTLAGAVTVVNSGALQGTTSQGLLAGSVDGQIGITNNASRTIAGQTVGLQATSTGAGLVAVTNNGIVAGATQEGIFGTTNTGALQVVNGGTVAGGTVGIRGVSTAGNIRIDNLAGALVQGAVVGIQTQATGGLATVSNEAGASIVAPLIFNNAGGAAVFNNAGVISGGITSAAGATNTTINNTGTWQVLATSTFMMAGAADAINNNGLFNVPTAASLATFNGLETFNNNAGALVNIANGATLSLAGSAFTNASRIDIGNGATLIVGSMTNNSAITMGTGATLQGTTNTLNNAGVIAVGAGGTITDAGAVNNLAGGQINFVNGGTITSGTNTISNAGQINLAAGNLTMNGNVTNTGLINMTNGATGQVITVNGGYTGGGTLGVDLNLNNRTSDQMVVTGAGAGNTIVALNRIGGGAVDGGIVTIVQGATGATYTVNGVALANGGSTLVDNAGLLQQFAVNNNGTLNIVSGINPATIGGLSAAVSSVLSSLNSFSEPASAFVTGPANPGANQVSIGVPWVRVRGGQFDIDSRSNVSGGGGLPARNIANKTSTYFRGFQVGADVGVYNINNTGWNVIVGAHGGQVTGSSGDGDTNVKLDQPFYGAYLVVKNDRFTFDAMIRRDEVDMKVSSTSGSINNQKLRAEGWSGLVSSQYRFSVTDTVTVTPSVAMLFSKVDVGSLPAQGIVTRWNTLDSIIGRVGVDISTVYQLSSQTFLVPFVNASIWHEFAGKVRATTTAGGNNFITSTDRVGTYYQVGLGTAITSPTQGFTGFLRGDLRFGEKISGYALNGGVRWQF